MEGLLLGKKSSGRRTSRSVSTKRRSTAPNGSGRKYELIGLILLAFALISGVGILGLNVGFVGFFFADFFRYLFGWGAPFALLIIALISLQYIIHHRGLLYTKKFLVSSACSFHFLPYGITWLFLLTRRYSRRILQMAGD